MAAEKAAVIAAAGHTGDGAGAACKGSSSSNRAGGRQAACCTCSSDPLAFVAGASSISSSSATRPLTGARGISSINSRFCSWCQQQQVCSAEQQLQLLQLAHAAQRPRAASCKRSCFLQWHVDLAAIRQLYEDVAAAGSRDSRILRSPAHSFAGYDGRKAPAVQQQQVQPSSPLLMQLVDSGFVLNAATISVREVGGKDKRCKKSWEHATVRYRASWGWPNYLDVQATGWDEDGFERWVIDGQMHLQANDILEWS
ncbi:hypothetical protein COO60DRAFT_1705774 [Scenedesmus sp. NREL 46B-D3]|nr:hypothetical protein COO60DRAFT_1705774 [Scenedesmus sp. NREL 46B-D3]